MTDRYDIIIVGTGAAGLFCALNLPTEANILIITKDDPENSDSFLAQGGISTLIDEADYEKYFEDTMRAGRYENDETSVEVLIKSSPAAIEDLIDLGVNFDKEGKEFDYTREAAHSSKRILHYKDATGREITGKLMQHAKKRPNITILPKTMMIDIMETDGVCSGVVAQLPDGTVAPIASRVVVWATGGIGGLFRHSTNYPHITGDAIGIAIKHGIELEDINYIQIHPTTLYTEKGGRSFLISESVRGEGAVLLNPDMERFVDELLPRDVVSAAIAEELKKFHAKHVWLSLRGMTKDYIQKRFPTIYEQCEQEGIHLPEDLIPVVPAQHYMMGGVKADIDGKTSMDNLFAVGEVSCNGVHGANRLASNSLLETLVFPKRAAHLIANEWKTIPIRETAFDANEYRDVPKLMDRYRESIQQEIEKRGGTLYAQWRDESDQH
ncbi:MAG: L-aspartate oxidase [Anaerofustis sp.]